jgi:hypothetical protein
MTTSLMPLVTLPMPLQHGLVILDADNQDLKRSFIPLKKNYYSKHRIKLF